MRNSKSNLLLSYAGRIAAISAVALCVGGREAGAQNEAPFTIRQPPDGATVREKVAIKVPLASIPNGGYVAYYIDGNFRVALSPSEEQREKAKPGDMFVYSWDTKVPYRPKGSVKDVPVAEGQHTLAARLYTPVQQGASVLKETSSVKVNVQNKYPTPGGEPIKLRYQYRDGDSKDYTRTGTTAIVAGLTQGASGTEDQEMISQNSELLVAVEDKYRNGDAIIRNLLKKLSIRQGGQETTYPKDALPKALYQEIDPWGNVKYQNHTVSFEEFAQQGIPVSATLELPVLPQQPVAMGDKWQSRNVSLDLPGTPPDKQPKVTATSTFEGIEWQGGYPTAKIHQHYDGSSGLKLREITVGNIEVQNPQIVFDQDVYLAYRSGTLVKVVRTLDITGKTLSITPSAAPGGPGVGGADGPGMMGGMMGRPGMGGGMPGSGGGGGGKMGAMMGSNGGGGGRRGGMGGMPGMPGMPGAPGGGGGRMGGSGGGRPGGMPGMMGAPGRPGMAGMAAGPGMMGGMGGATGQQPTQVKLKSTTITELKAGATPARASSVPR